MTDYDVLIPAQIYIAEIEPIIADEHRIYAHQLKAKLAGKIEIDLEEYTGIDVQKYLHQQTECLLEIIEAEFMPDKRKEDNDEIPDTVELEYVGYRYGYPSENTNCPFIICCFPQNITDRGGIGGKKKTESSKISTCEKEKMGYFLNMKTSKI